MTDKPRRVPSFFVLVPGPWDQADQVVRVLNSQGLDASPRTDERTSSDPVVVELLEDDHFADSFSWGRYGPVAEELTAQVSACRHAALVEFAFLLDEDPPRVAAVGRALRDAGGVAVRMEASGAVWDWNRWLERMESGSARDLYEVGVIPVRQADGTIFTCGMHHFDLPDAQINHLDPQEAVRWLDVFNLWQLEDAPALASGHTFRPDTGAERRAVVRWPDHRHPTPDGRHNPFGLWRLLDPGETDVAAGALVRFIIPSLASTLMAIEHRAGQPLSREVVEVLVADAPAIAMEPRQALAMERSRGYADIEPELAWEHWQIIRGWL